ncbi:MULTISPECIES: hypothetical protein [unclassified Brenneria]|uniref:hypothetical protein n=1 Tax=unclassified Brenneria TaxID=2634434 RepID=UPI0029C457B0|nr:MULTISPECIES: hypothetical protein [unclassified Brenneria]MDX5629104.1 hypothetical protein [Brenneria sp. L3-3Z]MDX5696243.1 hypothetical protein [Brenneria sp. L4-2C]MEE3662897.1 hypothetical protein [Brenneria sp. g21c3]
MLETAQADEVASDDTVFVPDVPGNDIFSPLLAGSRSIHDAHEEITAAVIVAMPLSDETVRIAYGRGNERSAGIEVLRADGEITPLWVKTAEKPQSGFNCGAGEE